ncbi:MAG: hypothetical protein KDK36_10100 [Leptospiraceae bacterium]|nr:hypothetical protein [Leptospiraceae bacterium]
MNKNWEQINSELYKNKTAGGYLKKYGEDDWRYIDKDNFDIQIPLKDLFDNPALSIADIVSKQNIRTFEFQLIDGQTEVVIEEEEYDLAKADLYLEGIRLQEYLFTLDKENNKILLNFSPNDGETLVCMCY